MLLEDDTGKWKFHKFANIEESEHNHSFTEESSMSHNQRKPSKRSANRLPIKIFDESITCNEKTQEGRYVRYGDTVRIMNGDFPGAKDILVSELLNDDSYPQRKDELKKSALNCRWLVINRI